MKLLGSERKGSNVSSEVAEAQKNCKACSFNQLAVNDIHCNDVSVSKEHGEFIVQASPSKLFLLDKSKFGCCINGVKVDSVKKVEVKTGEMVTFGSNEAGVRVEFEPLAICLSFLNQADKERITAEAKRYGITLTEDANIATHVVTSSFTFTPKILIALLRSIPVVSIAFFDNLIHRKSINEPLPDINGFLPRSSDTNQTELTAAPNEARRDVIRGKTFVFLTKTSYEKAKPVVEAGGGQVKQWSLTTRTKAKSFIDANYSAYFFDPGDEKEGQASKKFLESLGVRFVTNAHLVNAIVEADASILSPALDEPPNTQDIGLTQDLGLDGSSTQKLIPSGTSQKIGMGKRKRGDDESEESVEKKRGRWAQKEKSVMEPINEVKETEKEKAKVERKGREVVSSEKVKEETPKEKEKQEVAVNPRKRGKRSSPLVEQTKTQVIELLDDEEENENDKEKEKGKEREREEEKKEVDIQKGKGKEIGSTAKTQRQSRTLTPKLKAKMEEKQKETEGKENEREQEPGEERVKENVSSPKRGMKRLREEESEKEKEREARWRREEKPKLTTMSSLDMILAAPPEIKVIAVVGISRPPASSHFNPNPQSIPSVDSNPNDDDNGDDTRPQKRRRLDIQKADSGGDAEAPPSQEPRAVVIVQENLIVRPAGGTTPKRFKKQSFKPAEVMERARMVEAVATNPDPKWEELARQEEERIRWEKKKDTELWNDAASEGVRSQKKRPRSYSEPASRRKQEKNEDDDFVEVV